MRVTLLTALASIPVLSAAQQQLYDQCGGQGYTGPTNCVSGTSCQYQNQYYSQCLSSGPGNGISGGNTGNGGAPGKLYDQCGGQGWTGTTTCESGLTCQKQNEYYSQCLPGGPTTTANGPATTSGPVTGPSTRPPWWFGVNLSGAEFTPERKPGVYGKDYTWYNKASIDTLLSRGVNQFRVNFMMERLSPNGLTGLFDSNYLGNLTDQIDYITSKNAYAMIQPHNYGRFNGAVITDINGFKTWWQNLAAFYKNNQLVVFDTNNEYHDMDQGLVFNLNQAAIDGIRAAGATNQWITPEGNAYSGAWSWISSGNADSLINLRDPQNRLIFQMHQYLDEGYQGKSSTCLNATAFRDTLQAATAWLRSKKQLGVIGEYAGSNSDTCIKALQDGLSFLKTNKDVWTGSIWWAAGPWWGPSFFYDMEPPNGVAYTGILPQIESYAKL